MKIEYRVPTFRRSTLAVIDQANIILSEYAAQGYDLTVRQVYYQFVARAWIENTERSYKRIVKTVSDARLAGLLDWDYIVDRTRNLSAQSHWTTPADMIESALASYRLDRWIDQDVQPELWVEKEALVGVFARVCRKLDVPYFACRGYVSQSEMWAASRRYQRIINAGRRVVILHFGDHDPSGIDMSRDIQDRLAVFGVQVDFRRLALNMPQVEEYSPPPNPAKVTDSRFAGYLEEYGAESWELDALDPDKLTELVAREINDLCDGEAWEEVESAERSGRDVLQAVADHWGEIEEKYT